ncbi:MAG: sigma-70 family RNA polymerase sigma factor [Acidimicrobiia bacterium]|nr:sigma-70 family RNA polymerase sigma factor [Acidimicrobiia bacterium]
MPSAPETRDDTALVAACVDGDRDAFAALYRRHRDRTFRLALSVTGDREVAADVTQDVFLKLQDRLAAFEGRARFTTWLHRIVVNACHDTLRKRKPTPIPDDLEDIAAVESGTSEVNDRLAVVAALADLSEDFRVVVVLHDLYDHRYEEIAGILDIPLGTVKSRLARARLRLAELLRDPPREEEVGNNPAPRERRTPRTKP